MDSYITETNGWLDLIGVALGETVTTLNRKISFVCLCTVVTFMKILLIIFESE